MISAPDWFELDGDEKKSGGKPPFRTCQCDYVYLENSAVINFRQHLTDLHLTKTITL
jgi:hypothetical protein